MRATFVITDKYSHFSLFCVIVHWEQSFNCFITEDDISTKSVFEQFVRQSMALPKQPIVVFSQVVFTLANIDLIFAIILINCTVE